MLFHRPRSPARCGIGVSHICLPFFIDFGGYTILSPKLRKGKQISLHLEKENSIGIMARQELRNILEIVFGERFEWRFQRLLRGEGYADSEWAGMAEGDEAVVEVVGDGVDAHGKDGDDAVAREGEGGAGPGEPDVPEDVAHGRP